MKRLSLLLAAAVAAGLIAATAVHAIGGEATETVKIAYALVGADGSFERTRAENIASVKHPARGVYCVRTTFDSSDLIVPVSAAVDVSAKRLPTPPRKMRPPKVAIWRAKPTDLCTRGSRVATQATGGPLEIDTYACGSTGCVLQNLPFMVNPTG